MTDSAPPWTHTFEDPRVRGCAPSLQGGYCVVAANNINQSVETIHWWTRARSMPDGDGSETIRERRQRLSMVPRACEGCRIRKIRCDRSIPCSNCRTSEITCQSAHISSNSHPKPDRVTQLTEAVRHLDERLSRIERCITESRITQEHSSNRPLSVAAEFRESHLTPPTNTSELYEGASSFTAQAVEAAEAARTTVRTEGNRDEAGIESSFDSLNGLLLSSGTSSSTERHRFSRNSAPRYVPDIQLLPDKFIISILKSFKVRTPIFLTSYAINDASLVERLCQNVYFPTEAVSIGQLTAMHGILYFVLREYITLSHPLCSEYDLKSQLARCEYNVNSGLESYDVLAVPAFENVLALTMGIIKAQEEAKLLLCSTLICAAAGHCRMLGYHRETTYQNDRTGRAESMRRLFWTVYVFDKNISLLSGQSSCLRDSDIDASYPSPLVKPDLRPWDESFILGIKLAQLQGQIYDNLYSVSALRSALDDRKQSVGGLVPAMRQLRIELENIDGKHAANPQIFELSRKHWDVMYYSTLTSLLRASSIPGPGAEINSQCFEAARLSLQSHIQCFSGYHSTGFLTDADYSNWVLHFSSFTPFIVIFLHAIAGTCAEDVQLLDGMVGILKSMRRASDGSEKLYQICRTFARLARDLVASRCLGIGTYNQREDSLLFLDTLGPIPALQPDAIEDSCGLDMGDYRADWEAQDLSAILAGWVSGEQSAMSMF